MTRPTKDRRRVKAALEPFIKYRNDWIFHYPVYLNTFCLTYDLASQLAEKPEYNHQDPLGGNFIRHDWWRGLPNFTYRRDIEVFVAVDGMIDHARNQGHDIRSRHLVRFTRYDIKRVFVRRRRTAASRKWLLVTDIPSAAEQLLDSWEHQPPAWLKQFGSIQLAKKDIRLSFRRELHDLFADDGKIYVFSAPMAYVLKRQSGKRANAKYIEVGAGVKPIDTFYVFRCNSGVDPQKVRELAASVRRYYDLLFGAGGPARFLHPKVAFEYGRIASTVGQPQPFPELHLPTVMAKTSDDELIDRYAKILMDHHRD